MKGKIVDVHPVALKLQKKRKAVNTKDSVIGEKDGQKEGHTGLRKRNEGREEI